LERSLPADRNLIRRVCSALVFVPLFVVITYIGGIVFTLLIEVIIILGMAELYGILESSGLKPMKLPGYVIATGICLFSFHYASSPSLIVTAFTLTVILSFVLYTIGLYVGRAMASIIPTLGGILYVGWLFSLQVPLREAGAELLPGISMEADVVGWLLLLFGYSMVWTCDTSAYFVGRKFGRHKLVPSISPGKTVEGAVGGFLFTILVAFLFRILFLRQMPVVTTAILGMTTGVVCQLGDIFESALKRKGDVKDSSSIIPGHGGILDRFDGMLFALPVIYYILLAGAGFNSIH
jgi:phosphatidate cytidylyltransferase